MESMPRELANPLAKLADPMSQMPAGQELTNFTPLKQWAQSAHTVLGERDCEYEGTKLTHKRIDEMVTEAKLTLLRGDLQKLLTGHFDFVLDLENDVKRIRPLVAQVMGAEFNGQTLNEEFFESLITGAIMRVLTYDLDRLTDDEEEFYNQQEATQYGQRAKATLAVLMARGAEPMYCDKIVTAERIDGMVATAPVEN